jgi:hypothetical protein
MEVTCENDASETQENRSKEWAYSSESQLSNNQNAQSPMVTPKKEPRSWGSDDEQETEPTPPEAQQWKTPTSRSKITNRKREEACANLSQTRFSMADSRTRRLLQKAFMPKESSNRFSALDEVPKTETATDSKSPHHGDQVPSTAPINQDNDQSTQESEYSDNEESDDDSLDAMSIVSGSEIQSLEEATRDFEDDGYDTETTDNTSPSHKRRKPSRKASAKAQERIANFYETPDSFDTWEGLKRDTKSKNSNTKPNSPHLPLDTTPNSGGHGAEAT